MTGPRPAEPKPASPSGEGPVRWFPPDRGAADGLVLVGECGRALARVEHELRATDRFLEEGIDPSTRLLFSGPSGTGKTLAARWLGWRLRLELGVVDVAQMVSSYVGETSKHVGAAFDEAERRGAILFLDEVDGICAVRGGGHGSSADLELARATTSLLQRLDWLEPQHIVIAATNFPDGIDSALRRRLTTHVQFELPDRDGRRRMLEQWLGRSSLGAERLDALADATEGIAGAELRARAMAEARAHVVATRGAAPVPADELEARRRKQIEKGAQSVLFALESKTANGGTP